MPELPEVQTTVNGLQEHVVGLTIIDVWSNYDSPYFKGSETIKDRAYFKTFKKEVVGKKIVSAERRAKNILINLEGGGTILVHMKMTGHLLYGTYHFNTTHTKDPWKALEPEALRDPFNAHVRFILNLSNKKSLALSDVRKFAKVTFIPSHQKNTTTHLEGIGPEPLNDEFTLEVFKKRISTKPHGKIKQVLMDQSIIAGIGNIYADESLWRADIHPLERVENIEPKQSAKLFKAIKQTLSKGIDFGGDSTSDYRNVLGEKGTFHEGHHAYQRTGTPCDKKGCDGTIIRIILGARGTHFCDTHQRLNGVE